MPLDHPKVLAEAVLQQNPVAFLLVNRNGQVIFANDAAVELAWKDPHHTNINSQSAPEIWGSAQDFEARVIPVEEWPISLALRGVKTVAKELRMVRPDGTHYDISVTAAPLKTEESIIGAIASFIDITGRKLAEQKLTAINAQLEELATERARGIRLMHVIGVSITNATEIQEMFQIALTEICSQLKWPVGFAYIVEAPGRLHGIAGWYTSDPERYETLRCASASIDFSSRESVIGKVLSNGTTLFIADLDREEHFLRKDAARKAGLKSDLVVPVMVDKQVAAILEFFHGESFKPQDFILDVMDVIAAYLGQIVGQKRTEKKFQALFDSAPDAQIVTDVLGKIVMANRQTARLFGYGQDLLIGQPVEVLVPPELRPVHIEHRARYVATPHPRPMGIGIQLTAVSKDGTAIPVEVSLSPVELDEGLLIATAIRDVSERKKLQAQLREKERLAEMGKMAAIFAHEAANPLNGISTSAQLIKETLPEKYQDLIGDLNADIFHLTSLLNQFRSFSRLGDLEFVTVDLTSLAERVVKTHLPYWIKSGVHVVSEFAQDVIVDGDAERLHQVILNLSGNAVESMPNGGTLTLRTYSSGENAVFEITDTGTGIAEGMDVFELFTTTTAQGTGIGLYVVQQIVSAHGGTVTYSSKKEIGTTFRVSLPKKRNTKL